VPMLSTAPGGSVSVAPGVKTDAGERHRQMPSTRRLLAATAILVAITALFLGSVAASNPPGFYHDESDIAFNAASIARSGRDEHGALMPLYFSSFGDWKSSPFIYVLSGVFAVTGPSERAARAMSAALGLVAVMLIGLLGARLSGRLSVGVATAALAAATPWLFEVTRLVFEVALEPLLLAAFLVVLAGAREHPRWSLGRCTTLGVLLALVAYTYAAGRVLAPLLALALVVFATHERWRSVVWTWIAFVLALVPMAVFELRHPGALLARYHTISAGHEESTLGTIRSDLTNMVHDGSLWRWVAYGDPNPRHHVPGTGSLLLVTVALALAGAVIVIRRRRWDSFWAYVGLATIASVVPNAVTPDYLHSLRAIGLPVFLVTLAIPAIAWMFERVDSPTWQTAAVVLLVAAGLAQLGIFQFHYWRDGPDRVDAFEAAFPDVFRMASATGRPVVVYRVDHKALGDGLWYGRLWHVPVHVVEPGGSASRGSVVVTAEERCAACSTVSRGGDFRAYVTPSS
jgi:4-amino-4-deoxy-L-arabinose transferase-like glycosyltransferase